MGRKVLYMSTFRPIDKAEGVGFEPTSALRRQQFSRLPRSTAPAPLRGTRDPDPTEPDFIAGCPQFVQASLHPVSRRR